MRMSGDVAVQENHLESLDDISHVGMLVFVRALLDTL
jgi:hypothetical protein